MYLAKFVLSEPQGALNSRVNTTPKFLKVGTPKIMIGIVLQLNSMVLQCCSAPCSKDAAEMAKTLN